MAWRILIYLFWVPNHVFSFVLNRVYPHQPYINNIVRMSACLYQISLWLQLQLSEEELSRLKLEAQQLTEQLQTSQSTWEQTEGQLRSQCGHLEARVDELSQQNSMLHEEAEKVILACAMWCMCVRVSCSCMYMYMYMYGYRFPSYTFTCTCSCQQRSWRSSISQRRVWLLQWLTRPPRVTNLQNSFGRLSSEHFQTRMYGSVWLDRVRVHAVSLLLLSELTEYQHLLVVKM